MSEAMRHARALLRGHGRADVDSMAETIPGAPREERPTPISEEGITDLYETYSEEPGTSWVERAREAPTAPGLGVTDVESEQPVHRSKITAVLEILVTAVERLEHRADSDPRITTVVAEVAALDARVVALEAVQKSLVVIINQWKVQFWALLFFCALNLTGLALVLVVVIWAAGHLTAVAR